MLRGNFIKDNSEFLKHIKLEATRIVTEIRDNSSIIILYSELGLENLQSRRNKHNKWFSARIYVRFNSIIFFNILNMHIILGQMTLCVVYHNIGPKKYIHFSLGNIKESAILSQLRNEASNLNTHLFNDFLIDKSQCLYCGVWIWIFTNYIHVVYPYLLFFSMGLIIKSSLLCLCMFANINEDYKCPNVCVIEHVSQQYVLQSLMEGVLISI